MHRDILNSVYSLSLCLYPLPVTVIHNLSGLSIWFLWEMGWELTSSAGVATAWFWVVLLPASFPQGDCTRAKTTLAKEKTTKTPWFRVLRLHLWRSNVLYWHMMSDGGSWIYLHAGTKCIPEKIERMSNFYGQWRQKNWWTLSLFK